jgi:hypothetical protein
VITIDGVPLTNAGNAFDEKRTLDAGPHVIDITYSPRSIERHGGQLRIIGPDGVDLDITALE